jgi:hypothetical protein
MPIGKAPRYGVAKRIGGKVYRRSIQHEQGLTAKVRPDVRCTTVQFPKWTPGADSYDAMGNLRFHSRASAEAFAARNGVQYDPEGWDPCPSERTMRQMFDERRNEGRLSQADLERIAHG